MMKTKSDLWNLCYTAHRNTSFSPEKRADSLCNEYQIMLNDDLAKIEDLNDQEIYREKFDLLFRSWMRAKSRCISSMIT